MKKKLLALLSILSICLFATSSLGCAPEKLKEGLYMYSNEYLYANENSQKNRMGYICSPDTDCAGKQIAAPSNHYFKGDKISKEVTYICRAGGFWGGGNSWEPTAPVNILTENQLNKEREAAEKNKTLCVPEKLKEGLHMYSNEYLYVNANSQKNRTGYICSPENGCPEKQIKVPSGHYLSGDKVSKESTYVCRANGFFGGNSWVLIKESAPSTTKKENISNDVNEEFLAAVENGDLSGMNKALTSGANINATDSGSGWNALMWAVALDREAITKELLSKNISKVSKSTSENMGMPKNSTALDIAIIKKNKNIAKILKDAGVPFGIKSLADYNSLMGIAAAKTVSTGGINATDSYGWTELMINSVDSPLSTVKQIVEKGASLSNKSTKDYMAVPKNSTALDITIIFENKEVAKYLKDLNAPFGIKSLTDYNSLMGIVTDEEKKKKVEEENKKKEEENKKVKTEEKQKELNEEVSKAVKEKDVDVKKVTDLLDEGAQKDIVDEEGNTLLDIAIKNGDAELAKALSDAGVVQKTTGVMQYTALTNRPIVENPEIPDTPITPLEPNYSASLSIINDRSDSLIKTLGALETTVWRNEEGKFNTTRLLSDSIAGAVLGTAGGITTGVLLKKKQAEEGFENIQCEIGGRSVANFGESFTVSGQ